MPRYRVIPYRQGSQGARELANGLNGMVLRLTGSRFTPRRDDVLINWGNADPPYPQALNGRGIRTASNKLTFFRRLSQDADAVRYLPRLWDNARGIPDGDFPIVCRTVLAGHSGEGIVIANNRAELVQAPLYTKYYKKTDEYRIHVGWVGDDLRVISVQRKARRLDTPDNQVNWQVRNLAGGFIYAREGVNPPASVIEAAKAALRATELDFGAVDVIYHTGNRNTPVTTKVLEINTAPGLTGQTVDDYVRFFESQ